MKYKRGDILSLLSEEKGIPPRLFIVGYHSAADYSGQHRPDTYAMLYDLSGTHFISGLMPIEYIQRFYTLYTSILREDDEV